MSWFIQWFYLSIYYLRISYYLPDSLPALSKLSHKTKPWIYNLLSSWEDQQTNLHLNLISPLARRFNITPSIFRWENWNGERNLPQTAVLGQIRTELRSPDLNTTPTTSYHLLLKIMVCFLTNKTEHVKNYWNQHL